MKPPSSSYSWSAFLRNSWVGSRSGTPRRPASAGELCADPAAVVTRGADDVEAAGLDHPFVILVADQFGLGKGLVVGRLVHFGRVQAALVEEVRCGARGVGG